MALTSNQQKTAASLVKALEPTLGFAGACGAVGNMMAESGLNPAKINPNDKGKESAGLCQWRANRLTSLRKMASDKGQSWQSQSVQLAYLNKELSSNYRNVLSGCKSSSTPEQASEIWGDKFEVFSGHLDYNGPEHTKRKRYAREIYNGIKNGNWVAENLEEENSFNPSLDPNVYVAEGGNLEYSGPSNTPSPNSSDFQNITGFGIDWENDDSLIVFEKEAGSNEEPSSDFTPMQKTTAGKKPPTLSQKFKPSISISEHSVFATEEDISEQHNIAEGASTSDNDSSDTFAV